MRALLLAAILVCGTADAAEGFSFDMPETKLRFLVPDIPQIQMETHPNQGAQPAARYLGSDHRGITISILMPTAAQGMTAKDCAQSIARGVVTRFGVDPKFVSATQSNESTYVMVFPTKVGPVVQFKTFLMTAYNGTHCIEVHISKTVLTQDPAEVSEGLRKWYGGFGKATIEPVK